MATIAQNVMLAVLTPWHIGILLVIVLILFGGKKLPELARGMGRGLRIFKEEMASTKKTLQEAMDAEPEPQKEAPKQIKQETTTTQGAPVNQAHKDEHVG